RHTLVRGRSCPPRGFAFGVPTVADGTQPFSEEQHGENGTAAAGGRTRGRGACDLVGIGATAADRAPARTDRGGGWLDAHRQGRRGGRRGGEAHRQRCGIWGGQSEPGRDQTRALYRRPPRPPRPRPPPAPS